MLVVHHPDQALHDPELVFRLDAVLAVHDPEYVAFLQTAWERWNAIPGTGPDAIPNVHPIHRMHRKPTSLLGLLG